MYRGIVIGDENCSGAHFFMALSLTQHHDGSVLKTAEAFALEIGFVGSAQPMASGFAPG